MFWKNIAWSWGGAVGGDDDDDDGGASLLAADVSKAPDVSAATDLSGPGATTSTAAGPDRTKVQSPVRSPAPLHVNHQPLQGDSSRSSRGTTAYTAPTWEAKQKSNQWLLVSHMTQVTFSLIRTINIKGQVRVRAPSHWSVSHLLVSWLVGASE